MRQIACAAAVLLVVVGCHESASLSSARLAECETSQDGSVRWNVTGFARVDGGESARFVPGLPVLDVLRAESVELEPPPGDTLELWFESTNIFGCHQREPHEGAFSFER